MPGPDLFTGAPILGPAPCPAMPFRTDAVLLRGLGTGRVTCLAESPLRWTDGRASPFALTSPSLSHDGTVLAAVSQDRATYCEPGVYLFRPGAAPPHDRDCLIPIGIEILVGREAVLTPDGRRVAVTLAPFGAPDRVVLAEARSPGAPQLWLTPSQTSVRAGDTLVVTAFLAPGQPSRPVDAYVVIRQPPPGSGFLSITPAGVTNSILETPFATGFVPFAFQGEMLRYTFTGAEPPGDYDLLTGLVASDSGALISDLERMIIHVLP